MKKAILFAVLATAILLSICAFMTQQTTLEGKVTDQDTNDPVIFATVMLYQNDSLIAGTETNMEGYYKFDRIEPGFYHVKVRYVGCFDWEVRNHEVSEGIANVLNIQIKANEVMLDEVVITEYKAPLVDLDKTVSGAKVAGIRNVQKFKDLLTANKPPKFSIDPVYRPTQAESYEHLTENRFIPAKEEALSTFSIDVDRESYANIRRFLSAGQLPPKDAVRIEEMVNYFDYPYQRPVGKEPFALFSRLTICPWDTSHQILHLALNTRMVDKNILPPSNIVFLIDVSGSMGEPNKLPLVIASFRLLVDQLRETDRVAIVVYAGAAGCVLPSTPVSDKKEIIRALNKLQSGGSTAGGAGIQLAYAIAKENFIEGGNNRVVLATDGDFNVGVTENGPLEDLIASKRKEHIFLSVLGFGMGNYKSDKMQILADKGNGNHAYIDDIKEARKVLIEEFTGTMFTLAKDVKVQIEFNPVFVEAYRLIGYENRMLEKEDFNNDQKDAGEVGVGHSVTALYEIVPAGRNAPYVGQVDELVFQSRLNPAEPVNTRDLALFKVRYKEPEGLVSTKTEQTISVVAVDIENAGAATQFALAVAEFGMLLKDSGFKADASWNHVLELAQMATKGMKMSEDVGGYRAEFVELVRTAKDLSKSLSME